MKKHTGLAQKARHDPRVAALAALLEIAGTGDGAVLPDSQAVLEKFLGSPEMMPSDKGLCTELVYGCLRQYLRLDWWLGRLLPKPEKLPPELLMALRLAAYETAHLRSPDYAAVSWAVGHARNRFGLGLSKVANGALRSFQRAVRGPGGAEGKGGKNPAATEGEYFSPDFYERELPDKLRRLSVFYAMPEWIVELWTGSLGEEAALACLRASSETPPPGARVNPLKEDWKNLKHNLLQEQGSLPAGCNGVALAPASRLNLRPLHAAGRISVQSAAAHEALCALEPQGWPQPVWDACAGRGGKTLALLELGLPVALASDPAKGRIKALPEEMKRLGLPEELQPRVMQASAQKIGLGEGSGEDAALDPDVRFGTVLLDAPCSGLGTLARRPEIRLRRKPEDLPRLAGIQAAILEAAYSRLAEGGRIIYLTCTVSPLENEGSVNDFLAKHPDMRREKTFSTPPDSPLKEFFFGTALGKAKPA